MEIREWVLICCTAVTLISGWAQFWVKERLFNKDIVTSDPILKFFKSKWGISAFAITGIVAIVSIVCLVIEVNSEAPLTRIACFKISGLTVLTMVNILLIHAVYTLRRLATLKEQMQNAQDEAMMFTIAMS